MKLKSFILEYMETTQKFGTVIFLSALLGIVILLVIYFSPFKAVHWGKLEYLPAQSVVVTGEAKTQQKNQVARFSAGVNITNSNKDRAVSEANTKIQEIIDSVKAFGIPDKDIKTQNLSIYQVEDNYYDTDGSRKTRPGEWRVSNSIDVTLRDIDQASSLAELFTKSGANQVYGPTFSLDDTGDIEKTLLEEAINDAKEKAEIMAKSSGKTLGQVLSISEGSSSGITPMYALRGEMGGGGAPPVEPGSGTVYKSVTVTFELK